MEELEREFQVQGHAPIRLQETLNWILEPVLTIKDTAVESDNTTTVKRDEEVNHEAGDETRSSLPGDLMEKIIARLPFQHLFQARLLARRWASIILSSGSAETIFQREIMLNSLSSMWDSYCPIYVGMNGLVGYNLSSKLWEKILNLSYLPISEAEFGSLKLGNIAGCLLSFFSMNQYPNSKHQVWVTNPLNQSWKLLHPFSLTRRSKILLVHMECVGASNYKLIVITADHIVVEGPDAEVFLGAQVYESSGRCWTRYDPCTKRMEWMNVVSKWCSALVRDTLYIMGQIIFSEPILVAYNTKDEIWSRVTIYSPQPSTTFWSEAMLFACGTKTMIVNVRRDSGRVVTICELDHKSNSINPCGETETDLKVDGSCHTSWSCSPTTTLQLPLLFMGPVLKIASDERALYFFVPRDGSAVCEELDVRVFDVHQQVWSSLPQSMVLPISMPVRFRESYKWAKSAFQPGLNPFVET